MLWGYVRQTKKPANSCLCCMPTGLAKCIPVTPCDGTGTIHPHASATAQWRSNKSGPSAPPTALDFPSSILTGFRNPNKLTTRKLFLINPVHKTTHCCTHQPPTKMAAMESYPLPKLPKSTSPYILEKKAIACRKYQGLGTITYIDPRDDNKIPRERDYIFLVNRDLQKPVGALVLTTHLDEQGQPCVTLVQQFRPQYETDTIEFPAGFINRRGNETVEQAGIRELEEETTKTGTVTSTSPLLTSEPVPITALLNAVVVEGHDKKGSEAGKQRLDKGEFAVELEVPLLELESALRKAEREGVLVDPRVWMFVEGINCARKFGL